MLLDLPPAFQEQLAALLLPLGGAFLSHLRLLRLLLLGGELRLVRLLLPLLLVLALVRHGVASVVVLHPSRGPVIAEVHRLAPMDDGAHLLTIDSLGLE